MTVIELSESDLVSKYQPTVRAIARQLLHGLPDCVEFDDLVQAGFLGLLEARRRYREGGPARFSTFAWRRIHGAMVDEIRRGDWTPRSVHRGRRAADQERARLEQEKGGPVSDAAVAQSLGIDLEDYREQQDDSVSSQVVSAQDVNEQGSVYDTIVDMSHAAPDDLLASIELDRMVARARRALDSRSRTVLDRRFRDAWTNPDIAAALGISESRVCQIRNTALKRMRDLISRWAGRYDSEVTYKELIRYVASDDRPFGAVALMPKTGARRPPGVPGRRATAAVQAAA